MTKEELEDPKSTWWTDAGISIDRNDADGYFTVSY